MLLTLTPLADAGVVTLPPDLVWLKADGSRAGTGYGVRGDFAVSVSAADGPGGLEAKSPLQTAVIALLFTDVRVEGYEIDAGRAGDQRGWPGDGFDVDAAAGEQPLGSKLWLLRRMDLNDQTAMWAQAEAKRALAPLKTQGLCVKIEAKATPDFANDTLWLAIALYGRDGAQIYASKFDLIWKLATGGA
jgi:phage gp46-like protein